MSFWRPIIGCSAVGLLSLLSWLALHGAFGSGLFYTLSTSVLVLLVLRSGTVISTEVL